MIFLKQLSEVTCVDMPVDFFLSSRQSDAINDARVVLFVTKNDTLVVQQSAENS
jgi:hypothetical protein